jgi:hypothetical protein
MKKLIGVIAVVLALSTGLSEIYAVEDFPVFYWQMLNEGIYVYRYDMDNLNWREIRKERDLRRTAHEKPKLLELHYSRFQSPFAGPGERAGSLMDSGTILVRDPDGKVKRLMRAEAENGIVSIPEELKLNGRYLLGGHFYLGKCDVDGVGRLEAVHVYAKHIVTHYKADGRAGACSEVFFNDPENMALEIGPVVSYSRTRMAGGAQMPHNPYEMTVLYRNRPLPGVLITVKAEGSGWQRTFLTDNKGQFRIIPFDDRSGEHHWQKFFYMATYHDLAQEAFHIATLPVIVYRNRPEWTSQVAGFTAWIIIGSVGCILLIFACARRRKRLQEHALLSFEDYRIKEG